MIGRQRTVTAMARGGTEGQKKKKKKIKKTTEMKAGQRERQPRRKKPVLGEAALLSDTLLMCQSISHSDAASLQSRHTHTHTHTHTKEERDKA